MSNASTMIPNDLITAELDGIYGATVLAEMGKIIQLYKVYEHGKDVVAEGTNGDYAAADLRFKQTRAIIDKEARFLFAKSPDIQIIDPIADAGNKVAIDAITSYNNLISAVLKANAFSRKIIQAAKDCFIGKRVACILNFHDVYGIGLRFIPSLEFIYDTDLQDPDKVTKIVAFYMLHDNQAKGAQRIYKKKYWLGDDGYCWVEEAIYDGMGALVETVMDETKTLLSFIPAVVIINDGLTSDVSGASEVDLLQDGEDWLTRLGNADIDAMRKGMNPIRYTIDMSNSSTEKLSTAPGAYWDLASDQNGASDDPKGSVGVLEASLGYSDAMSTTLTRIRSSMLDQIDMPDIRELDLKIASGKALKAIYWGLIVRCDEKMLSWRPALEAMARMIIEGAKVYPNSAAVHMRGFVVSDMDYEVIVENQYPLPEDEAEEKAVDIMEVNAQAMSRKTYMQKWRGLTDDEARAELQQIAMEGNMFDHSGMPPMGYAGADGGGLTGEA